MREKRSQRRLSVGIPIHVRLPSSDDSIEVRDQELSWGGAKFITSDARIWDSRRICLVFPWVGGQSFAIEADIVRRELLEDGGHRIAVRFVCMDQQSEARLEHLLALLAEREEHQSSACSTPTMERLELIFDDEHEMREQLSQIADGHLYVTVFGAYEIDQSILLVVGCTRDFPGLHLRARVKSQALQKSLKDGWIDLVKLDLTFEHPREELRRLAGVLSRS